MSDPPMGRPPEYFDALYGRNLDPWKFKTSPYERQKYDATLAALPRDRFAMALEVGCSIGVFTRRLAPRCDGLLALDVSARALDQARGQCAGLDHVAFERRVIPDEWPDGRFDLIVLSEVLYFLGTEAIARTARCVRASLSEGGCVVLVNWLGDTDTALSGETAADLFLAALGGEAGVTTARVKTERQPGETLPGYRLDCVSA